MQTLTRFTSSHCLLGPEFRNEMSEEVARIYDALERGIVPIAYLNAQLPTPAFRRRDKARVRLGEMVSEIVSRRRRSGVEGQDFTTILLQMETPGERRPTVRLVRAGDRSRVSRPETIRPQPDVRRMSPRAPTTPEPRPEGRMGVERDIAMIVPSFTAAARVAAASDLVAGVPRSLIDSLGEAAPLQVIETPDGGLRMDMHLVWHDRTDRDPVCAFFREQIIEAMGDST